MFDIKPMGESASLVLVQIKKELDLRFKKEPAPKIKPNPSLDNSKLGLGKSKTTIEKPKIPPDDSYWEELIARLPQRPDFPLKYELTTFSRAAILRELEKTLAEPVNLATELTSVGGQVHHQAQLKPRAKITTRKKLGNIAPENTPKAENLENFWTEVEPSEPIGTNLAADMHQHSPASREIEVWLENLQKNRGMLSPNPALEKNRQLPAARTKKAFFKGGVKWSSWFKFNRKAMVYFLAVALSGLAVWSLVNQRGINARNNIVQNGNNAVANLEQAKQELEGLNFIKAADSFALAYDDLNKASGTLNQLGVSFLSVFGSLPGLNKVKAVNNIVEAGQNLSKAGENLALAFGTLYKTNLLSFLGTKNENQASGPSISKFLVEFKDILNFAEKNINRADRLLADIDSSLIPSDKQKLFSDFKSKIPEFQKYIGEAIDYSDFLLKLVGNDGAKTYLVLLQNNSELRPTGGFPGSYALITFENGILKKIFVDDIYRADAGIRENIVPPIPLQHITPNWGARDAGWFADFPFSARKTIELYQLGGGPRVDGVLTITPDVIARIFEVIGPIEMPDYGVTLDANNFLAEIQNEVEYEADRSAPKQILSDLQPRFFERLARQDKDRWLAIFKIISEAAEQKHILAYFENRDLEEVAIKNGLGGEIKSGPSTSSGQVDYLQVVFSNIKGSKTDFVTENSMNLETEFDGNGALSHTLTVNRAHNGGDSKYGFYNRDNSAYIKVYVPEGSVLESIQGQSITDFKSLIGHEDFGFKKDPDLARVEGSITNPFAGIDVFEESGKTVLGFWLITKPQQIKSVTLKYRTPVSLAGGKYSLLWQKQSGTGQDQIGFNFKVPEGKEVKHKTADLEQLGDNLILNSDLSVDREFDILLK